MKAFITKYALSRGIECRDVVLRPYEGAVVYCENKGDYPTYLYGEGREWHRTKASAIEMSEKIRAKKLASLKKQIKKLEALKFV